ncbi:MAG: calcium/sodium antiporter [Lachnospiraceae bacterium]|nr:calcium/sodium antiporter [Lachnospiraceae bacterium]
MIIPVLLFALGLVLLIKGGDWFVDGATGIAKRSKLPDIVVGATVVSIGTTLPEVMVSTTGAVQGLSSMAYGNAIGSIICNTALIAAISIAFNPGPVNTKSMRMPVIFFFSSAAVYCIAAYLLGKFPRIIGIIMLAICLVYLFLTVHQGMKNPDSVEVEEEEETKEHPLWLELIMLVGGAALIAVGAKLLVDNGTLIAQALKVPETVIALTFVALGTSLPELVTTITSLRKGHAQLGIGNVIGANVFNLVLVSGVSVTIAPFAVPEGKLLFGQNASLVLDIPLMLCVMLLMCVPALVKKKLSRWQGIILLAIYVAFVTFQFFV